MKKSKTSRKKALFAGYLLRTACTSTLSRISVSAWSGWLGPPDEDGERVLSVSTRTSPNEMLITTPSFAPWVCWSEWILYEAICASVDDGEVSSLSVPYALRTLAFPLVNVTLDAPHGGTGGGGRYVWILLPDVTVLCVLDTFSRGNKPGSRNDLVRAGKVLACNLLKRDQFKTKKGIILRMATSFCSVFEVVRLSIPRRGHWRYRKRRVLICYACDKIGRLA